MLQADNYLWYIQSNISGFLMASSCNLKPACPLVPMLVTGALDGAGQYLSFGASAGAGAGHNLIFSAGAGASATHNFISGAGAGAGRTRTLGAGAGAGAISRCRCRL